MLRLLLALGLALLPLLPSPARAVDGVVEISQTAALAGGITPGDAAGFPVTLSRSGSYLLTTDLVVADASLDGIAIAADDVTLDLNGFAVRGPVDCAGSGSAVSCGAGTGTGIDTASLRDGSVVRNGSVTGFGAIGIVVGALNPGFGAENRIERVRVVRNGGGGIRGGLDTIVSHVVALGNGGDGIDLSRRGVVESSISTGNSGDGIAVATAGVIRGCATADNGLVGFSVGADSLITESTARSNGAGGIDAGANTGVRANVASGNAMFQLDQFSGGYSANTFSGATVITGTGVNAGQNVCNNALCP